MTVFDFEGKHIFISGAMSGIPDYNSDVFAAVKKEFVSRGATHVFNPAAHVPNPADEKPHEYYMRKCLHELTRIKEDGEPFYDAVAMLSGWVRSSGSISECIVANSCGIRVIRQIEGEWV